MTGFGERCEITVTGLTKRFGPVLAIDDLTFSVPPASVTGFLGPNGAGKTTTMRCLLGLVTPDAGTAAIGGSHYSDLRRPLHTVGAALEASSFHPGRTARNHLRVLCTAAGIEDRRADEVLDLTGLSEAADRRVGGYSTGMRQRLALATALLGDPPVLLLDEPATGLDPAGVTWLRQLLRYFAIEHGKTVLVSSHLLSEMEQTADNIVIIAKGRLVRQGALSALTASGSPTVRVRTPQPDQLVSALRDAGLTIETEAETIVVRGGDAALVGHVAFTHGVELSQLTEERTDLEKVFLDLTETAPAGAR